MSISFYQQLRSPFYSVGIGEALRLAKERMNQKNVYFTNPSFDK